MDPVLRLFSSYRRRRRWVLGLDHFLETAFVLGMAAAATLLLDRLAFETGIAPARLGGRAPVLVLLGGALGLAAVAAVLRIIARPVSDARLAWELDRAAEGEDRLLSAVELAGGDAPFVQALSRDAGRLAGATDAARLLPRVPVGYRWGLALALGAGALLWSFPPSLFDPPHADFDASPRRGPAPLEVSFHDASIGAIEAFLWDFGDGGTGTGERSRHVYAKPGRYVARLTVHGPGGRARAEREVEVLPPDRAVADFDVRPRKGRAPLKASFEDLSRNALRRRWDFGDGTASTEPSPVHVYREPGWYTVKLRVENDLGADEKVRERLVKAAHPEEPLADFRAFPRQGPAPLEVYFEDASEGAIDSWSWDFGDLGAPDRISTERNPTHVYRRPGTYTVRLRVKGPHGEDEEEKVRYIRVKDDGDGAGGGGGGGDRRPPQAPAAPGGLAAKQQPAERPKVELVPEALQAHRPGTDLVEKDLNVFSERAPGAGGRPEPLPLDQVVRQFRRAAEDSIERERIAPSARDLVRLYYEGLAPK
jgi:PKD repeat protein